MAGALRPAPRGAVPAAGDLVEGWPSRPVRMRDRLRQRRSFWIGLAGVALFMLGALGAPLLAPADPNFAFRDGGLTDAGSPVGPSPRFPLGTDLLGRDYLSRLLFGARVSLLVGIGANVVGSALGTLVGMAAAVVGTASLRLPVLPGGRAVVVSLPVESLLMRLTDAVLAFPVLLLAIALAAVVGPSLELTLAIVIAFQWVFMARITYSIVRSLRTQPFVEAARAAGASQASIARRHLLPHVAPVAVAYAALGVSVAILFEATLSYLGVGVPPPQPSWGSMIAEHVSYYASDPRLLLVPGAAIVLTVICFNLLGDAVRDALDPTLIDR